MKSFENAKRELRKEGYGLVGKNSAVKICLWTKNSLNKKEICWKEKFYGIKSHRCAQMTCSLFNCENMCLHCWRNLSNTKQGPMENPDDPEEILDGIVKARKKLLIGFKGNKNVSKKEFEEACEPTLFTMSLSGEPTIYPRLGELINEIRKRKCISFLVTNGQNPKEIKKLERENSLPTQLTVSVNAPNEKLFKIWHRSSKKDAWKKFNETLDLVKNLKEKTRRALRLTLVKVGKQPKKKFNDLTNMSGKNVLEYVELIKKANPDFIHVVGFKSVGWARERMDYDKMPWHNEVKIFAKKLVKELKKEGYKILGEEERSCVVLLGKSRRGMKIDLRGV